jgi:hypothetical protein
MNMRYLALAPAAALALSVAAPAQAESTVYAYQGKDYAAILPSTAEGFVADKECDGHPVRVMLTAKRGFVVYVTDKNGCSGGVGRFDYASIDTMQVQEKIDGHWVGGTRVSVR